MSYTDLFTYRDDAELHRRVYIKKPSAITSMKDLNYYDGNAQQAIAEAQALIETLTDYRRALYERYQEIAAANYTLHLHLERRVKYDGSKSYHVTICKRFDSGNVADENILTENFQGKERHKALARFEALKKEYPNISHDMDIEKKHWER
jgi:hypothetical protein